MRHDHSRSKLLKILIVMVILLLTASACQVSAPSASPPQTTTSGSPAPSSSSTAPVPVGAADFQAAIRQVVQRVKPAVVQITSQQSQVGQFNQPFTVPSGVGSGIIYDNQGHILTNDHVVNGAQKFLVTLPDGRTFKDAKLIGADPQTDIAVIQISGDNLPVAELGDSDQLQVGDWVVAIGNALGLPGGPTVTQGVVSALDRTAQEPGDGVSSSGPYLFGVVQTDAPINPGNSGGPLANLAGQVIGINTLVAGQAEPGVQAQGIGFAISMATAKPIADELVANGKVVHPYMGIGYVPLNPGSAAQMSVSNEHGALVQRVEPNSPASQGGVQTHDVITEIDGQALKDESALPKTVNSHKPGDKITLTVIRDGKSMQIPLTLGEMPS